MICWFGMKKADIEHLASLARLRLSEDELNNFENELSSILDYVGQVSQMVADQTDSEPQVGARYNVFRADEVTNQPNEYTEAILDEMPNTADRFMSVKKILQLDE